MTEELFRDFWWLIFPVFGMVVAIIGMIQHGARENAVLRDGCERLERGQ